MAGDSLAIQESIRASYALALRLDGELETWERRDGQAAPATARELSRLARAIAAGMRTSLQAHALATSTGSFPDLDTIVGLNARASIVERLHSLLESSSYRLLHPVLGPTVRTEMRALNVPGQVLVCGTRDVLYEVQTFREKNLASLVPADVLKTFTWPLFVFRVPNVPLDWPLHHVLLYHEIGHTLLSATPNWPPFQLPATFDPAGATTLFEQAQRTVLAEKFRQAYINWLTELYADAVGVQLAGPAYAFAFCGFLGGFFPLNEASLTHPPVALRIRYLRQSLESIGCLGTLPTHMRDLFDAWQVRSDALHGQGYRFPKDTEAGKRIIAPLVGAVDRAYEYVLQMAVADVGARAYVADTFVEDLRRGGLLLEHNVPPIEQVTGSGNSRDSSPLEPAQTFSAVWAGFLRETASPLALQDLPARTEYYARVLLGSLDGAEALRVWRAQ